MPKWILKVMYGHSAFLFKILLIKPPPQKQSSSEGVSKSDFRKRNLKAKNLKLSKRWSSSLQEISKKTTVDLYLSLQNWDHLIYEEHITIFLKCTTTILPTTGPKRTGKHYF